MQIQVEYKFPTEPLAYRFLNTASYFEAEQLKVRRGKNARHVQVSYRYSQSGFDDTASRLDDLARDMEGEEVGS